MPITLGLGSVGANIIGGALGNLFGGSDRDQAQQLQAQALQNILGVNAPSIDQLKVALEKYQVAGQLSPEAQATIAQQASQMGNISTDPRLQQAQMAALSQLQQVGAGGMRPEDAAAIEQIKQQTAQQANAQNQAILQQMQERGIGGSGAELAAKLGASQAAAGRGLTGGLDVAGQASQRALQAILQSGQLGGQMQAQSFGQQAQQAQAQDIINRYNAMNAQQVLGGNVAARNQAQASNLANLQNIMNQNTGIANQQQFANVNAAQQNFQNLMGRAQAAAGAEQQAAGQAQQRAQQTQNMWSGMGSAVGQGLAGYGAQQQQQNQFNQFMNRAYPKQPAAPAFSAGSIPGLQGGMPLSGGQMPEGQ